jgi:hypothetical protein
MDKREKSFIESLNVSEELYQSAKERIAEDENFIVENWYPYLKDFTAQTHFISLCFEEVEAIIIYYRQAYLNRNELSKNHVEVLKSLEEKIKKIQIKDLNYQPFFVRLSIRSPKDGESCKNINKSEKIEEEYLKIKKKWKPHEWKLHEFKNDTNMILDSENTCTLSEEDIEANFKLISHFKFCDKYNLKCESSEDAMNLILSSERVYVDLINFLKYRLNVDKYESQEEKNLIKNLKNIQISIRKWVEIDSLYEFRCFVKNNKLTAISQYNPYIIVEEFLCDGNLFQIRDKIFTFWNEKVKEKISFLNDYVIDLAILSDNSVYVIELNPFKKTTGASFFNWTLDLQLLEGNLLIEGEEQTSVVIRARKSPYSGVKGYVTMLEEEDEKKKTFDHYSQNFLNVLENYTTKEKSKCLIF